MYVHSDFELGGSEILGEHWEQGCGFPWPTVSLGCEVGRGFMCSFRASESFRKEEMLFLPKGK